MSALSLIPVENPEKGSSSAPGSRWLLGLSLRLSVCLSARRLHNTGSSRVYGIFVGKQNRRSPPLFLPLIPYLPPSTLLAVTKRENERASLYLRGWRNLLSVCARAARRCSAYFEYIRKDP